MDFKRKELLFDNIIIMWTGGGQYEGAGRGEVVAIEERGGGGTDVLESFRGGEMRGNIP